MLHVVKMVATGNDFLFVDVRAGMPAAFLDLDRSQIVRFLCDRHFGLGSDGFVFVETGAQPSRLRWDFYNSDGSHAEMCGNASRCFGRWASLEAGLREAELETVSGLVRTEVLEGDTVVSHLDYVDVKFAPMAFALRGSQKHAVLVNTGVPHAVIEIKDIGAVTEETEAVRLLRFHPGAGERGANVTFLQRLSEDSFATVTFERGVEGFTLSCGTGVLAAAAVGLRFSEKKKALLRTPGGELGVEFGPHWRGARLQGAARRVFETHISRNFFEGVPV